MREIELIEKRGKREKHFLQENGEIIARVYSDDIHFLKNGKYEEIDNTLLKEGRCYVNKNNKYKVSFNEDIKDGLMNIELDNHYLKFILKDGKTSLLKKKNDKSKLFKKINYENVFDNIDFEYDINPTKVKEGIVLKNKSAVKTKLCFDVITNLTLTLLEDGSINAEYEGTHVFKIDAPYMLDSNNVINKNVFYKLKDKNGQYELSLDLDQKWLNEPTTKYPVYVDPTISTDTTNNSVYDTYIYSGDTLVDRNSQGYLKVGVERINNVDIINRALIKVDLPVLGTGSQVISATLNLYPYSDYIPEDGNGYDVKWRKIAVHQVTTPWDEVDANWNLMNDKYNSRVVNWLLGTRTISGQDVYSQPVMITELVKKWYSDTPNYGILLKEYDETYSSEPLPMFYSKDYEYATSNPGAFLEITYRNHNGLEGYLNYDAIEFRGGAHYINTYNGNLTTSFNIGNTLDGKLPVSLNLFYNTNDVVKNLNTGLGKGYKLGHQQTIKVSNIDGYLEYLDADGTIHYFSNYKMILDEETSEIVTVQEENTYYDEDGLDMTISKTETEFVLIDKKSNKMVFTIVDEIGKLSLIENKEGYKNYVYYNTDGMITKIKDANDSEINIEYSTDLITIISPEQIVKLRYDDNLTVIETIYGNINLTYNSNGCVSSIKDFSNQKYCYDYCSETPYRIKKVTHYGLNDKLGEWMSYSYGYNVTTTTDNKNRVTTITYKNNGTISSISNLKSKEDVDNAVGFTANYGTYFQTNNKLTGFNSPVKTVKNLLSNSSFEDGTHEFSTLGADINVVDGISNSGDKSLCVLPGYPTDEIYKSFNLKKGKSYTFSAYFKNYGILKLSLVGDINENSELVAECDTFTRHSVTIKLDGNETEYEEVVLKITAIKPDMFYMDDMQLEESDVANQYNYIDNSDFENGISGYDITAYNNDDGTDVDVSTLYEIVTLSNGKKALKLKMGPSYTLSVRKNFNITGKSGDLYNISFWYKNKGIECDSQDGYGNITNNVIINYEYTDESEGECAFASDPLTPNEDEWQFFTESFVAEKDFNSITLNMFQGRNANELYITNVCVFKDVKNYGYLYDENGNVKEVSDLDGDTTSFNYNKENKLTKITNPLGDNASFEYDNHNDKIMRCILSSRILNEAKYDNLDNLTQTKIANNSNNEELTDDQYYIKINGEKKYFRNINNDIGIDSDACHDLWSVEKDGDYFKISHSIVTNKFLTEKDNDLTLSEFSDDKSLFKIIRNDNKSYTIQNKSTGNYLKYDNAFSFSPKEENSNFEFYFEKDIDNLFTEENTEYTQSGKYIKTITDTLFNNTNYVVDETTGLRKSIENSKKYTTHYTYDTKKRVSSVTDGTRTVNYQYDENDKIVKLSYGDLEYNFIYDEFGNNTQVKLNNNIVLITNVFEENNGNLLSCTYGNNHTISYQYDEYDRISRLIKSDKVYEYKYDDRGNLASIVGDGSKMFYYDLAKRLTLYASGDFLVNYSYDKNDRIIKQEHSLLPFTDMVDVYPKSTIENTYSENLLTKNKFDTSTYDYNYDEIGRISSKVIDNTYTSHFEYVTNGKRTSLLPKSIKNGNDKYKYKYDKLNNITHVYFNDILINKYVYDEFNQLIEDINYKINIKTCYKYDNYGNLLTKKKLHIDDNSLITQDKFEYNALNWRDQLTKVNNDIITYDILGNPLSIGSKELSWVNGRELNEYTNGNLVCNYKYDENGIRTSKIINKNGEIENHDYYLEGENIIYERVSIDNDEKYVIYYKRNSIENIVGFDYLYINPDAYRTEYLKKSYHYIKNIQNDIIGLLDENYNVVARYEYDVLGNIISILDGNGNDISNELDNIANINPIRYRGYYYDKEIDLYYLNTRYYNPSWGRFINVDDVAGSNGDITSLNLYTYTSNNIVNLCDNGGNFALPAYWLLAAGVAFITGALGLYYTQTDEIAKGVSSSLSEVSETAKDIVDANTRENKEKKNNNKCNDKVKNQTVYRLVDNTGDTLYVGRTVNVSATIARHKNNPHRKHLTLKKLTFNKVDYCTARGLEEAYIKHYKTLHKPYEDPKTPNQIRGISLLNPYRELYLKYADDVFGSETYVGR